MKLKWVLVPNESMLSITDSDEYSGYNDSELWSPVCVEKTNSVLSGVAYTPYTQPDGYKIDYVTLSFRPNPVLQFDNNDFRLLSNNYPPEHAKLQFPYFADWVTKNSPIYYIYIGKNGYVEPALYLIDTYTTQLYTN
jgi:hypothetical protein